MVQLNKSWLRIERLVKWTGLSVNAFARSIGLNRSENLYQIKRGNHGISKELAELITSKYNNVSKAWLLTGEGEMLPDEGSTIPYFRMDAILYATAVAPPVPDYHISYPPFQDCDFAALAMGDAMAPGMPQGAVVFCRETATEDILPGEDYLIVSRHFKGIRTIRKEPESDVLRLVPHNRKAFDEVLVPIGEIRRIFLIRGIVITKSV